MSNGSTAKASTTNSGEGLFTRMRRGIRGGKVARFLIECKIETMDKASLADTAGTVDVHARGLVCFDCCRGLDRTAGHRSSEGHGANIEIGVGLKDTIG